MTSDVDVVNVSLRLVGANRIISLSDDVSPAPEANDMYQQTLDDILRQNAWNFATRRAKLARLTEAPVFEFDYAYAVPSDWIRTVSVHPNDAGQGHMFYREELVDNKRTILASVEDVYMRYVARITDPNLWSTDFRNAVSMVLARNLAIPLADSNTLFVNLDATSKQALARARSTDAMGSSPERLPRGSWVTGRGGRRRPIVGSTS